MRMHEREALNNVSYIAIPVDLKGNRMRFQVSCTVRKELPGIQRDIM